MHRWFWRRVVLARSPVDSHILIGLPCGAVPADDDRLIEIASAPDDVHATPQIPISPTHKNKADVHPPLGIGADARLGTAAGG